MLEANNKTRVLVVEDNQELLMVLKSLLKNEGFQVMASDDTEQIWDQIDNFKPDLLLLDVWVEPLSGGKVAQQVESDKLGFDLPVILISADDQVKQIAEKTGVEGYLEKPFDFDSLLGMINQCTA